MVAAVAMETIPRREASPASGGEGGESAAQGLAPCGRREAADMGGGGGKWRGGKEPERSWTGGWCAPGLKLEEGGDWGGDDDGDVSAELRRGRGGGYSNPIQTMLLDGTGRAGFLCLDRTGPQYRSQLLEPFAAENVVSVGLGWEGRACSGFVTHGCTALK
jgi:hypothetical protein